jgi:hypothetical protein
MRQHRLVRAVALAESALIEAVLVAGGTVVIGDQHIHVGWARIGNGPTLQWLVFKLLAH